MSPRFETERFHIETGPDALFERIQTVMDESKELRFTDHAEQRVEELDAPREKLKYFDPDQWDLKTAEVRTDKAVFVNTAWSCKADGSDWWVIIGLHDDVLTVIKTEKEGLGSDIVTEGELYNRVNNVNHEKNKEEN